MDKRVLIQIRVENKETLDRWKSAALDQRYSNFSQFVRDAIEEKIASKKW